MIMRLRKLLIAVCVNFKIPVISSLQSNNKKLILIRHGCSEANEFMYREGNRWGDPNFTDEEQYVDTILSGKGREQAQSLWSKSAELRNILQKLQDSVASDFNESKECVTDQVLIVTSPLTRTIETLSIGILPHLKKHANGNAIRAIAQPLATERVYTASDTGRPFSELQKHFPHIDFTDCFSSAQDSNDPNSLEEWWYTHNPEKDGSYSEWRPSDKNQFYAVPGESQPAFDDRMSRLFKWIDKRPEQTIILVTHWGVIRYITEEDDVENCGVRIIDFDTLRSR